MTCKICHKGKMITTRGREICTSCMRRICHKCSKPILRTESMHETGTGCAHLDGCPGIPSSRRICRDVRRGKGIRIRRNAAH
jgi:hypothetical protein